MWDIIVKTKNKKQEKAVKAFLKSQDIDYSSVVQEEAAAYRTKKDTRPKKLMALFMLLFTITCVLICIAFFRKNQFSISGEYLWGIRLGIVFFIIFSLEGGLMAAKFSHTAGSPDGGPGLPFISWSTQYGDLRIAHFLGIHSLQLLPLLGYYIAKSKKQIIGLSVIYFIIVMAVFIQALSGRPLLF